SSHVVTDVTTLNFNLMFESGFALGLGLPIIPIRDSSLLTDKLPFDELGLLDTIGFTDFVNSQQLATLLPARVPVSPMPSPTAAPDREQPLYVVKGPLETEGEVRLLSTLKKSALRFRAYDSIETPRLSLHEVRKQVASSLGVAAHLLHPDRKGAGVHNARCALVCGVAMASGKSLLMLQEGEVRQPIDYRDLVQSYRSPDQVGQFADRLILSVIESLQTVLPKTVHRSEGLLERLDIGDVAAENEIRPLRTYFVQ